MSVNRREVRRTKSEVRSGKAERETFRISHFGLRTFLRLWTSPNTALGLCFVPAALLSGGRVRRVEGVLEVHGPAVAWLLRWGSVLPGGVAAVTFGHVVVGRDAQTLDRTRRHERVHVRQYERWGPFFLPAYLLASVAALARGGDAYRDNRFEREAYAVSG